MSFVKFGPGKAVLFLWAQTRFYYVRTVKPYDILKEHLDEVCVLHQELHNLEVSFSY